MAKFEHFFVNYFIAAKYKYFMSNFFFEIFDNAKKST